MIKKLKDERIRIDDKYWQIYRGLAKKVNTQSERKSKRIMKCVQKYHTKKNKLDYLRGVAANIEVAHSTGEAGEPNEN